MGENTHTQLYFTHKIHRKIIIHGTLPELLDFFYIILDHVANFLISFTCKATADKKNNHKSQNAAAKILTGITDLILINTFHSVTSYCRVKHIK